MPTGPTAFVRTPTLRAAEELADDLVRLTADLAVAPGRGWLAEELLPALIKERSPDHLVVHGPVVLPADEDAVNRFARAEWLLRARRERRPLIRR